MLEAAWLIPGLPLAGFIILVLFGRKLAEPVAGWLGTLFVSASFVATLVTFFGLRSSDEKLNLSDQRFTWISAGDFKVDMGLLVDPLSITMCLFITGIGALIHLYSIGYMHGDKNFSKFFVYLNLFVGSMLLLVLGDNLLLTFLGWEGVGACSYLLISFWFEDKSNASAGKKAFVTNRVGDFGFMLATFLVFAEIGSINYLNIAESYQAIPRGAADNSATIIVLLFLLAAAGKSAQLPLYVWLPDAMAGPTPVSALIHAATMVTSGVFLLTRLNPILATADLWSLSLISWVGALTAMFAATIALAQTDIKKVLAYSTVSQLGYLFLAVGAGAYVPAIFHMITHACFKALLFLGSGSVIHGLGDEQDMRRMGGLKKFMPVTAFTFIVGWLAISGVPPFSGFWSKDEILLYIWNSETIAGAKALWAVGLVTAVLTAFYMTRQVILTFFGRTRFFDVSVEELRVAWQARMENVSDEDEARELRSLALHAPRPAESVTALTGPTDITDIEQDLPDSYEQRQSAKPHESPSTMTIPLIVLAGLATVAGAINLPFTSDLHFLGHWLEPSLFHNEAHVTASAGTKWILAVIAVTAGLVAIAASYAVYFKGKADPAQIEGNALRNGWYVDSTYAKFFGGPGRSIFNAMAWFDRTVVDGCIRGIASTVSSCGNILRVAQPGFVRSYALAIIAGTILVVLWFVSRLFS